MKLLTKFRNINKRLEQYPKHWPELLSLILYLCSKLAVSIFHEPWLDEAVAWQIARSSSLKDILFYIPHYEGHPPLWHLILLPFAKLGAPYESSLIFISTLFSCLAIALLLFHSPFPRIMKLLMPFTYFLFYQYAVICRPYCVMMLAFMLLAMAYRTRNEHPIRYTLCLILLCATSAYGIVFAGGLAMVWLIDILHEDTLWSSFKKALYDKRIHCLVLLLLWAVILIINFFPYSDTYINDAAANCTFGYRLLYTSLILPAEITCTNIFEVTNYLKGTSFDFYDLIYGCFFGILILFVIADYGRKKKTLLLFFIPHILFAVFGASVYLCTHHIGLELFFLIFWLWVSISSPKPQSLPKHTPFPKKEKYVHILTRCLLILVMFVSVFWNISACMNEINHSYSPGREEAAYIKEHGLEHYRIFAQWTSRMVKGDNGDVLANSTNHSWYYTLLPYFDTKPFYNGEFGMDGNYRMNKVPTEEEMNALFAEWKRQDYPDVLVGTPDLEVVFGNEISYNDYTLVFQSISGVIWKNNIEKSRSNIYVRNDLLDMLGLEFLDLPFIILN